MTTITRSLIILLSSSTTLLAVDLVNVSGARNTALGGYDPVAFFTDSRPVIGSPSISSRFQGAVYLFASQANKALFEENPAKYAPQYGGYCAYGVAHGKLAPVDINTWQVRDGKLYLNVNADVLKKFNADIETHIANADRNWPGLVAKNGK